MSELGPADKILCQGYDSDKVTDEEDEVDPVELPHLKSLSEAITCLGDICEFLESSGYTKEANSSNSLLDSLAKLFCTSETKQTSITDYFS